jgi:hypothetical protein
MKSNIKALPFLLLLLISPAPLFGAVPSPTALERLEGNAALAHLNNLKVRHPLAFARAMKAMRDHGFKPTEIVDVVRNTARAGARPRSHVPGIFLAQDYVADSTGELVMWSWDDGDASTWEGVIYAESYSDGIYVTEDSQINVVSDPYPVWEYTAAAYDSGGNDLLLIKNRIHRQSPVPQIASASADMQRAIVEGTPPNSIELARVPEPVRAWLACTIGGCGSAAWGCAVSGPGWGHCFLGWCGGAALGCAGGTLLFYMLR